MKSVILGIVVVVLLAGGVGGFLVYRGYQDFLAQELPLPSQGKVVLVEPGDSLTAVLRKLEGEGVTHVDWRWRLLARSQPVTVHVGEYLLEPPMQPADLLAHLDSGKVLQHRFTIVEGWSFLQLMNAIAADPVLEQTIDGPVHPAEIEIIAEAIGAPDLEHAEGWFLPETYYFVRGERDVDLLARAHQAMKQALEEAWQARDTGLPLETPYELLTLASIVEKETSVAEERSRISGVFVRRLNKGMRLQTDPTVIYGIGPSFDGDIRRRDLQTDTPYNTYTRDGLPPTPIALPGRDALFATVTPADEEALFFVADGKGGHTFSKTLEEHNRAVRKLIEMQ